MDTAKAFVPGVRRGFVLVPLTDDSHPLSSQEIGRINTLLSAFKASNYHTPAGNRDWLAWSLPPQARQKAAFGGKVKRCAHELAATPPRVDVEWKTGSVWVNDERVASASAPPPGDRELCTLPSGAWIDLHQLCRVTQSNHSAAQDRWKALSAKLT